MNILGETRQQLQWHKGTEKNGFTNASLDPAEQYKLDLQRQIEENRRRKEEERRKEIELERREIAK